MVSDRWALSFAALALWGCNSLLAIEDHPLATSLGPDASRGADGPSSSDAGNALPLGPPGCFRGTPSTDADFFNQCTTSQYQAFDNCARLRLCGEQTPPLFDPPPAGSDSTPTGDPPVRPATLCYDATARNKLIFMQGSTNFTPFIQAMAPLVAKNGYVIVWQPTSSCAGAASGGFDMTPGKNRMTNPAAAGQSFASFYDNKGVGTPCVLGNSPTAPDAESEITDIGDSDVFANGCALPSGQSPWVPGSAAYPDVGHYLGPIQAMVFVAPASSAQRVISAEAARMVFGMGGNGGVAAPWTDPARMFIRGSTTGTNNILSRAIDVPSDKWWGVDTKTAPAMQTAIVTASQADAERTIGTLSMDYAEKVKDALHILYFQAKGQLSGFLPDSSPNSLDKRNVRDGHYAAWGPIHLYTKLAGGQASAAAAAFIIPFNVPNAALIDANIAGGAVPQCAMHVSRDQEMGPIHALTPSFSCDCYYDFKVSGGNACQKCNGPADCPATLPACNLGYCEED